MRLITTNGGEQLTIKSDGGRITADVAASFLSAYSYAPKASLRKVVVDLEGAYDIDEEAWKFWLVLAERAKRRAIEVAVDYPQDVDVSRLVPLELARQCRCLPCDVTKPAREAAEKKRKTNASARQGARGY